MHQKIKSVFIFFLLFSPLKELKTCWLWSTFHVSYPLLPSCHGPSYFVGYILNLSKNRPQSCKLSSLMAAMLGPGF